MCPWWPGLVTGLTQVFPIKMPPIHIVQKYQVCFYRKGNTILRPPFLDFTFATSRLPLLPKQNAKKVHDTCRPRVGNMSGHILATCQGTCRPRVGHVSGHMSALCRPRVMCHVSRTMSTEFQVRDTFKKQNLCKSLPK